jgi:hypothetical protein
MAGNYYKATIDNLMKQGEMGAQIVPSKEKMSIFGKYDVRLVATGKERERAIKYQALLNREEWRMAVDRESLSGTPLAYWLSLGTAKFAILFG